MRERNRKIKLLCECCYKAVYLTIKEIRDLIDTGQLIRCDKCKEHNDAKPSKPVENIQG